MSGPDNIECLPAPNGQHCFCASSPFQHAVMNHHDERCCWCGKDRCVKLEPHHDPKHGLFQRAPLRAALSPASERAGTRQEEGK